MTNLSIEMFIKMLCAAILRLAEVKDELIKDIQGKNVKLGQKTNS